MKRFLLVLFALNLGFSYSQTSVAVQSEANPKWFIGAGLGGTWQQSDMQAYAGMGFDFNFGKWFYKKPTRFFGFAWRFKYLHGNTFGMDTKRNSDLSSNSAYNAASPNGISYYKDTVGYTFNNYRMELNEYSLELMLGFNRLRERTGIVLNLYGGIGLTQHWSKTDQKDEFGGYYDYSLLDSAGNNTLADLNNAREVSNIRQLDFESDNDTYSGSKTVFMPSIGFELGYQFGKWFSMGIGHKVTFALNDEIDGAVNRVVGQGTNDRWHYSNVYFRFFIGGGNGVHSNTNNNNNNYNNNNNTNNNNNNNNTNNNNNNTNPPPMDNKPVVHFTNPASCPTVVQNPTINIKANVYYIKGSNQIVFKVNGVLVSSFNYSPATQQFLSLPLNLQPGDNIIEIKATNEAGSDYQSCVINYQTTLNLNPLPPPIITVHNPPTNPYTTYSQNITISATILNITTSSEISYRVNGVLNSGFFFNPANGSFSSSISLNEGPNTIEIKATNTVGQDKEILSIIYQKPVTIQPPIVTIYNPGVNPYTVTTNSAAVNATVLNVSSASNISVKVNGVNYTGFTFNPTTTQLSLTTPLITGSNVIEIKGTNAAGSDAENTTIIYQPVPVNLPPVVTITDPIVNPYTTTVDNKVVKAIVHNVSSSSQVSVKLNGSPVTGFAFINTTGAVTFTANLIPGANVVEIKGTNPYGTDSKSTTIIYNKVTTGLPPVVVFNYPLSNPYNTTIVNETVVATVLNVASAANINVTVNGTPTTSFTFNAASGVLSLPTTLVTGNNVVSVKGTNAYGNDTETTNLIYSTPCYSPVLSTVSPATASLTTVVSPFNFITIASNITNASQLSLQMNGTSAPFTFDASTGSVSASLNLNVGVNNIKLTASNNCGNSILNYIITYAKPLVPPVVTYTNPNVNPITVTSAAYTVKATVLNVSSTSGITFKMNGVINNSFTFNAATHEFTSSITLVTGSNIFELTGTNTDGSDSKTTIIVYSPTPPPCDPAVVVITNPYSATSTTTNTSLSLVAVVTNATSAQVTVKLNGVSVPFTLTGVNLNATLTLAEGINTINIIAQTSCGTAIQDRTVTYTRLPEPPVVTITNPGTNPYDSPTANLTLNAKIYKVSSASNVTFKINGVVSTAFTFVPATNDFVANYLLTTPVTTFEITGTNSDGTDSKTETVNYTVITPACIKPTISWTSASGATVTNSAYTLKGIVTDVAVTTNITVKLNGLTVPFTYTAATKQLKVVSTLIIGSNVYTVTATNDCGTVTENFEITYTEPCVMPNIMLLIPVITTVESAPFAFNGTITGVTAAQITVTINGVTAPFTLSGTDFNMSGTLIPGLNKIIVKATNDCGTKTQTYDITYVAPVVIPSNPPSVTITSPASSGTTISNPAFTFKATTHNISNASEVNMLVNGVAYTSFTFNAGTNSVSAPLTLIPGSNNINITVTNTDGTDTKSTTITYEIPCTVPNITVPSPASANIAVNSYTLSATVTNVTSTQVTVKNGTETIPFTLTGTTLSIPCSLNEGVNVISVNATNICGTDNATFTITYTKPVVPTPPTVSITAPATSGSTVTSATYIFKATTTNIDNASQVSMTVNGVNYAAFNFNTTSKKIEAGLELNEGLNTITITVTNTDGTDTKSTSITYNAPAVPTPPTVIITAPSAPGSIVSVSTYAFKASTNHIDNASQVSMTVNGVNYTSFTFNTSGSKKVEANLMLNEGMNDITITVTNTDGTDTKSTNIRYAAPVIPTPPTVTITDPASSGSVVASPTCSFKANTTNIDNATQVSMTVNGVNFTAFNFNTGTKKIEADLTLNEGMNNITITVTNSDGTDTKSTSIKYTAPVIPTPPTVTITAPVSAGTTVANAAYTFKANTTNIDNASQVSITVNGVTYTSFDFNTGSKKVEADLTLNGGVNNITIKVTNDDGMDTKSTSITYTETTMNICHHPPGNPTNTQQLTIPISAWAAHLAHGDTQGDCPVIVPTPPKVIITAPGAAGTSVEDATYTFKASTDNIDNASQVSMTVNGVNYLAFNFNTGSKHVEANLTLNEGMNNITITVTNTDGTDTKTTTIKYTAPVIPTPPTLTITAPNAAGSVVTNSTYTFKANTTNVDNASQVNMTVNGVGYSTFSFNSGSKKVEANLILNEGLNNISITVTNSDGTDSKSTTITYNESTMNICHHPPGNPTNTQQLTIPVSAWAAHLAHGDTEGDCPVVVTTTPPTVTITAPSATGSTVNNSAYTFKANTTNIDNASQVTMKLNGVNYTVFNFNTGSKKVEADLTLNEGLNTIAITVTNGDGADTKSTTITYTAPVEATMNICHHPPGNPDNTQQLTIPISAWAAHQAHGDTEGDCPIVVPTPAPKVDITAPAAAGSSVTSPTYNFKANTEEVSNASEVSMTVNGVNYTTFNFNNGNKKVDANLTLNEGLNNISIKVTTTGGTETKSTTISYNAPVETTMNICHHPPGNPTNTQQLTIPVSAWPAHLAHGDTEGDCPTAPIPAPKVDITAPAATGSSVTSPAYNFKANTQEVSNASEVSMMVNGVNYTTFNFNNGNKKVDANLSLTEGLNNISIKVTTAGGTETKSTTITYTAEPEFDVTSNGTVTTSTNFCATIKCIGEDVMYNGSEQAYVKVGVSTNGSTYYGFNSNNKVAGGETQTILVPSGSSVSLKAYCYNNSNTWNNTLTSNSGSEWVHVLKNGDNAPIIEPAAGQTAVGDYLAGVIVAGKISLAPTDVIYLFELRHVGSIGIDYQDVIMLITFNEGAGCSAPTLPFSTGSTAPAAPPVINVTKPGSSSTTVTSTSYTFKADVSNVTSSQITMTVNGNAFTGFTYNATTDKLEAPLTLTMGDNAVVINATNTDGSDSKTRTIKRTASTVIASPPTVTIVAPASEGSTVNTAAYAFKANTSNVDNASEVSMTVNGKTYPSFGFTETKGIEANLTLNTGSNNITITVTNENGTDTKTTTVMFGEPCIAPNMVSSSPALKGATLTNPSLNFTATLQGISAASQIAFKHNGTVIAGFYFNPSTGSLSKTLTLTPGANTINISATNTCGNINKDFSFTYSAAATALPPAINITNPAGGSVTVTNSNFIVSGNVQNISSASDLKVLFNGVNFTGFIYTSSAKMLSIPVILVSGTNTIQITATTALGNDVETFSVTYNEPVAKMVTICHHPPGNPTNTQQLTIPMSAWPAHQAHGDTMGDCPAKDGGNKEGNKEENKEGNKEGDKAPTVVLTPMQQIEYNKSIQRANNAFNAKNYAGAKADFQKALSIKANDKTALDGIKKCEDALKPAEVEKTDGDKVKVLPRGGNGQLPKSNPPK